MGSLARALSQNFHVFSPSLRNHGKSPWFAKMDYPAQANDILQIMDQQHLEQGYLVGHSMGGKVAMVLALLHPKRCRGLVVLDIAPIPYHTPSFENYLTHLKQLPTAQLRSRKQADQLLAPHIPEPKIRSYLLTNLLLGTNNARWRCNLQALHQETPTITGFPTQHLAQHSYSGPTLFLHSPNSGYLHPQHLPTIHKYFPQAKCEAIQGAGHWLHIDRPQETHQHIQNFLANIP